MPFSLENVSYSYRSFNGDLIPALNDISFTIRDGEFAGIMGHTGCGKTTLIQSMAGLLVPSSGKVLLDGKDINAKDYDRAVLRRNLSLVFQFPEYQLFESTVEMDLAFALKHSGLPGDEVKARVKWALEIMGFSYEKVRSLSPLSLSGGEKRRIAIAGALVTKPRFLIFDEPITGLDPLSCQLFLSTVTQLNSEGTTIIMISHNADVLGEYASRILVLDKSFLVMDGAVEEVFSDVETLRSLHLNAGTPRIICEMLSRRGIAIPAKTTSYSALLGALTSQLKGMGSK